MAALKTLVLALSILLLCLVGCGGSSSGGDITLHIMTEDYYPYNYLEGGAWQGSSYEVVREILTRHGRAETIEPRDWSSALQALETEDNAVLFTTALTPERKQRFKWVGPVGRAGWALFAKDGRIGALRSLTEARPYRIAVVQDYPAHERLVQAAQPNLVVFPTLDEALAAFFSGQVELAASDSDTIYFYAAGHGLDFSAVQKVYDIKTELLYIAFSQGVPDSIVSRWQATLDQMKAERVFAEIYARYLPHSMPPEKLQLYTEQYPPVTFRDAEGRITGGATDVVRGIIAKLDLPDNIVLTNWENAYNLALDNPRVVLFSTERTAAREELFEWVGPIGRNSASFYTRSGSGIVVDSIEQAKGLRAVGTCSSWFTEQTLREMGFTNLVSVTEPEELARRLMNGEIEATVFTDITANDIISSAGFTMQQFSKQHQLSSTDFYIAVNKETDPQIVADWRSALDEMVADGTFTAIYEAWYPGAENPYRSVGY